MTVDAERMVPVAGGAEVCAQAFGSDRNPAVLLVMGQMASMLWWPDEFCEWLADSGRFVVRYDNRDTGRSTSYPAGDPEYSFDDFVGDAVAVLDAYGIGRAHVVGMSMGGMIGQLLAIRHPERLASLTLIDTSRADGGGEEELPAPTDDYLAASEQSAALDWSDEDAIAAMIVADMAALAGSRHPHDEAAAKRFVARDQARALSPTSLVNHTQLEGDDFPEAGLSRIAAPTLVIHGSSDPLFPLEHGESLASAIDGAALHIVEGGGHELHRGDWDELIEAISAHSAQADSGA
jgi:pimeloyl-ACP methyl ester carboxylesterase